MGPITDFCDFKPLKKKNCKHFGRKLEAGISKFIPTIISMRKIFWGS